MANLIETLVATAPITSPSDEFFNFFKYRFHEIVNIFPEAYKDVQLLEGQEGTEGCVMLCSYVLGIGGVKESAKVKFDAIDNAGKSITMTALEGSDALQFYKSFQVVITVSDGEAKWTITYEKASDLTPSPDLYASVATTLSTLIDAYLLAN